MEHADFIHYYCNLYADMAPNFFIVYSDIEPVYNRESNKKIKQVIILP